MSSTPNPADRPKNPTHYGGDGLYESTGVEDVTSGKTRLRGQVHHAAQRSLRAAKHAGGSALDYVKRNPGPVLAALGGLVWLLASRRRRPDRS